MFVRNFRHPLLLTSVVFIAACGSGGGDEGNTSPIDDRPGPGPIMIIGNTCTGANGAIPVDQDSDNDGLPDCDELIEYNTNPELADTDGDGLNDMLEVVTFDPDSNLVRRNPLVSDLARIAIDLTSVPQIELSFTDSNQTTQSIATSHDQSVSSGTSTSRGSESSRQLAVGHTLSVEATQTVGVEVSTSPTDLGVSTSYEASLSTGLQSSRTQTTGSTVSWTNEQRQENANTFSRAEEVSNTTGTVFDGGTLRVTAQVRNDGSLAYDLENLTLSAFIFDPSRPFEMEPVGNLTFSGGTFPTTSVTTNSLSAPFNFSLDLTLPQARRLLRDSENLVIAPATFRLIDQQNRSLLLLDEDVAAQTAKIFIDFGVQSNRLETHRVAVNMGNGRRSINAARALNEVLGLQVVEGEGSWIFGSQGAATQTNGGVTSIAGFAMSSDRNQYWYGALNSSTADSSGSRTTEVLNLLQAGYALSDIELRAGDTLAFVLVTDSDRDALPNRYEMEFGTDPQRLDTDGDTLGDATEIYGSDLSGPPCNLGPGNVFVSDPRLADSDADGTDDATEIANCENPSFRVIADAGQDQTVNAGMSVTLSGQAQGIFSGQPQYSWRQMSGPSVLVNGEPTMSLQGVSPQFMAPDEVSTLSFTLDVEVDGGMSSDQVTVQVQRDRSAAVYVSSANSGSEDGSINAPFATLQRAVSSLSPGEDLYVMTAINDGEVLPYSLASSLEIPDGTNMYGGYNNNWIRDVETQLTPVVLQGNPGSEGVFSYQSISGQMELSGFALSAQTGTSQPSDNMAALFVAGGAGTFTVENNVLIAGDVNASPTAIPGSSYGARITSLARLEFLDNQVIAGAGGTGSAGSTGSNGESGRGGSSGSGRSGGRGASGRGGADGGGGGEGATGLECGGFRGGNAGGAGAGNSGSGGSAGGGTGRAGRPGNAGSAGSAAGLFESSSGMFMPASGNTGTSGGNGTGGGGGGGGHADGFGACGGGGGGGGEAGTGSAPGGGGNGGGSSIGVWLYEVNDSQLRGNTITATNGGEAGTGGSAGTAGGGGAGGGGAAGVVVGFQRGGRGGNGGRGGSGGRGGDGSGGAGGPSIGIFVGPNLTPFIQNNGITTGQGGDGGANGNSGSGGDSVGIYDANTNDGAVPVNIDNRFTLGMPGENGTPSNGGSTGANGCSGETNCL